MSKQKNEWAEIYGSLKQENEQLKLSIKVDRGSNPTAERELAKKLKKREAECQALWDTLKDMQVSGKNVFDVRQMTDLLAIR